MFLSGTDHYDGTLELWTDTQRCADSMIKYSIKQTAAYPWYQRVMLWSATILCTRTQFYHQSIARLSDQQKILPQLWENLFQFAVYSPPVQFPSKQCVIMTQTLDLLPHLYLPGVAAVTPEVTTATYSSNDPHLLSSMEWDMALPCHSHRRIRWEYQRGNSLPPIPLMIL